MEYQSASMKYCNCYRHFPKRSEITDPNKLTAVIGWNGLFFSKMLTFFDLLLTMPTILNDVSNSRMCLFMFATDDISLNIQIKVT